MLEIAEFDPENTKNYRQYKQTFLRHSKQMQRELKLF